jgi:hypothetical protein
MAMATRVVGEQQQWQQRGQWRWQWQLQHSMVVGDKEGNGNNGKSVGDGNKDGWQATAMRAFATRVAG